MQLRKRRLAAAGLGLLLALAAGELLLRWRCAGAALTQTLAQAELHERDPGRGYRLIAGATAHGSHVDALGLRGPEVAAERPPGRLRVLCVGDSITYGAAVAADADTYPAQLQRALGAAGLGEVEVLNGGVMGYGSRQCRQWLAELLPVVQPDLVLCCVGWNDLTFARVRGWHPGLDWLTPGDVWRLDESYLLDYVRRHLLGRPRRPDPRALEFYAQQVEQLVALCRQQQRKLAFLNLPTVFAPAMSGAALAKAASNGYVAAESVSFLQFRTRWQELARRLGVPLLRTGFEYEVAAADKEPLLVDVCCPDRGGCARMVEQLAPQVAGLLRAH